MPTLDPAEVAAAVRAAVPGIGRVVVVARTGSTSSDLVANAAAWPDRSLLVADHQAQGHGRQGRAWQTPPGEALTMSILVRPGTPVDRFGWLPLLGGLAVVRALTDLGVPAALKWPNDVLVLDADEELPGWGRDRKVAGVLGELVPGDPPAAVVGIGVNVRQRELPVASATSLALWGDPPDRTDLLAAVVGAFCDLDDRWRAADGDAVTAGVAAEVAAACTTLGARVRVERPGGVALQGRATGLAPDGALRVRDDAGREHQILAGDVEHLRV